MLLVMHMPVKLRMPKKSRWTSWSRKRTLKMVSRSIILNLAWSGAAELRFKANITISRMATFYALMRLATLLLARNSHTSTSVVNPKYGRK
jgi:hypothetical protein